MRRKGIEVSGEQEARGQWSGEGRNKRWVQVKNEREEGGEGRRRRGKKAEKEGGGEGRRRREKGVFSRVDACVYICWCVHLRVCERVRPISQRQHHVGHHAPAHSRCSNRLFRCRACHTGRDRRRCSQKSHGSSSPHMCLLLSHPGKWQECPRGRRQDRIEGCGVRKHDRERRT